MRLGFVGIALGGALERGLGLVGDDAVRRRGQRLAEIGLAVGALALERQQFAARGDGVVEAAEAQIDRRQHFLAARVVRIAFQMRLDLRDHRRDRALWMRVLEPGGERLAG